MNSASSESSSIKKRKLFSTKYVALERRKGYILACVFFSSILVYALVNRFVLATVEVVGPSMFPTLQPGERHLMHRWPYYFRAPQRGELVVIDSADNEEMAVKRVVALPGESIEIRRDGVYVDGLLLVEPYLDPDQRTFPGLYGEEALLIPEGHYFAMGDNRNNSEDSRLVGPIHVSRLEGLIPPKSPH